ARSFPQERRIPDALAGSKRVATTRPRGCAVSQATARQELGTFGSATALTRSRRDLTHNCCHAAKSCHGSHQGSHAYGTTTSPLSRLRWQPWRRRWRRRPVGCARCGAASLILVLPLVLVLLGVSARASWV